MKTIKFCKWYWLYLNGLQISLMVTSVRIKNIEYVMRGRDSKSAKSRDDSIKLFSTQLHPKHFNVEICRVGLYTELFYAIVPALFLRFLLICYPYISSHLLMLFILVHVTFLQQMHAWAEVCHLTQSSKSASQASSVDVCSIAWRIIVTRPGSLQTLPTHQLYF